MESDRKTEKAELKVLGTTRKRSRDFPGSPPAMEWNPLAMQETSVRFLGRGRSAGEGIGYPLQYSSLQNSMHRGAWQAAVHGITESVSGFHFTS